MKANPGQRWEFLYSERNIVVETIAPHKVGYQGKIVQIKKSIYNNDSIGDIQNFSIGYDEMWIYLEGQDVSQ